MCGTAAVCRQDGRMLLKRVLAALTILTLILSGCGTAQSAAHANSDLADGLRSLRIAIDPGHGGIDRGASGGKTGVHEDDLNLAVAQLLAKKFMLAGSDVLLTRDSAEVDYGEDGNTYKRKDMNHRAKVVQEQDPHVVVSIHMNTYPNAKLSGAQTFYDKGSEEGQKLAQSIQQALRDGLPGKNTREIKPGDYFVLKMVEKPSALVECGFLSNAEEEKKLSDPEYQQKIADCIYQGICNYLGVQ
jgi:N-acetylmuramoyl-L-alanine amidase